MLDFGGQYSQLIARRIRECGVYAELLPSSTSLEAIRERKPKGLILSGGPASVYEDEAPPFPTQLLDLGIPMLGICYGMQAMVLALGGRVESAESGEFGRTELVLTDGGGRLLGGLPEEQSCWMSHRDAVFEAPDGFVALASSPSSPVAACEMPDRGLYGIQFHPEVVHTPYGTEILTRFLRDVAGCVERWSPQSVIAEQVAKIQAQVGEGRVICGLSGGVDSSVAAMLVHRAVGDRLTCVFVDHGLMRLNEAEQVVETFSQFDIPLVHVDAEERFLAKLAGVDDPEAKRKIIGTEFIRVFEDEAAKLEDVSYLVQGTLYSDVIESGGSDHAATIKSHHNVGGLPDDLEFELVEPLRMLFKDEVRAVGAELGLPERMVWRQPFPGPGLGIRIVGGEVTRERLDILRAADAILQEEIRAAEPLPSALAVLLRAAGHPLGRRAGRRAHVRLPDRDPRRHVRRRDDRRLGAASLRPAREGLQSDHQRGARHQPRVPGHLLEAAGDDRVGVRPRSPRSASASGIAPLALGTCFDYHPPAAQARPRGFFLIETR